MVQMAAEQYLRESLSQNTRRAYRAQISKWVEWCAQKRVEPWPADLVQVVNYLSERADAGQAVSTIRTAVAAIRFSHEAQGLPFDSRALAIVKVLKGITRTSGKIAKQAEPIRAHDAFRAITVEDDANVIELRDAAVIAMGYLFVWFRAISMTIGWKFVVSFAQSVNVERNPWPVTLPLSPIRLSDSRKTILESGLPGVLPGKT